MTDIQKVGRFYRQTKSANFIDRLTSTDLAVYARSSSSVYTEEK